MMASLNSEERVELQKLVNARRIEQLTKLGEIGGLDDASYG